MQTKSHAKLLSSHEISQQAGVTMKNKHHISSKFLLSLKCDF